MSSHTAGKLQIDLGAVRENYRIVKSRVARDCEVAASVKANGYGLGAIEIVKALQKEGCKSFFVASPEQGVRLREFSKNANIFIFNGFYEQSQDLYIDNNLIAVLGDMDNLESYARIAEKVAKRLSVALDFNTGMNRLGFGCAKAEEVIERIKKTDMLDIVLVMSHLASADDKSDPLNQKQYDQFKKIAALFPNTKKAFANSFGVFSNSDYHFDMVKPGMALYGLNPTPGKPNPMKVVVSLNVPVLRIRKVKAGEQVGYNATYTFERDSCLATVAAGYGQGLFRILSNKGELYWKSRACPIRGRVSMDLTTVDITDVPENERPQVGDFLEILGEHQSADDLAADAGTIGYEMITALGSKFDRHYIDSPEVQDAREHKLEGKDIDPLLPIRNVINS
nr:alanine racemase [Cytophagales bacterium]